MKQNKSVYARKAFAFVVPLTLLAFYFSELTMPNQIEIFGDGKEYIFDSVALGICAVGVFVYNWFEEKK